jgi:hypothetical protein
MIDPARLPDLRARQHNDHNKEVSDYYYHTWMDYFLAWTDPKNLALHFGYQDGTPLSGACGCQQQELQRLSGDRLARRH